MIDLDRIQAVFFDLDGTIIDTDDLYVHRLARTLHPLRWMFPEEDPTRFARCAVLLAETPANNIVIMADRLGLDEIAAPLLDQRRRRKAARGKGDHVVINGVLQALDQVQQECPIALITAREEHSTRAIIEHLDLDTYFQVVATSRTCRRSKPHPAPLLWAAEQVQVEPSACVMVGDTTVDIRTGVAAGAQTIGVLCGFGERRELEHAGADLILDTTADVGAVLLGNR